jgi:hypothetical protein
MLILMAHHRFADAPQAHVGARIFLWLLSCRAAFSQSTPAAIGGQSCSTFDFTRLDHDDIAEQAAVGNNPRG